MLTEDSLEKAFIINECWMLLNRFLLFLKELYGFYASLWYGEGFWILKQIRIPGVNPT